MTLREQIRAEMPKVSHEVIDECVTLCKEAAREGKTMITLRVVDTLPPPLLEQMKVDWKRNALAAALVSAGLNAVSFGVDTCYASCLLDISW